MERVMAPRNVFVNFPLGRPCGKPNDGDLQIKILKETLGHLENATVPGDFADLTYQWNEPFNWDCYLKDVQEMITSESAEVQEWKPK